ncbi:NUDIX domain-containing protein [Rossellomorea aquimaris]|uniref:NUDIX domain-containing protein n=1 Tax=Rossellomorea aquimaris TaxID=189382 RepID=UPI001CD52BA1|nr:NUDIX domain-containing protein [Rossellomorea aquimaris]MCA1054200.1 NUDIX domain-containing protein [Rossellomorea aquimaris]
MIAQALVMKDNRILMVKQSVQRGDIVWNYPGGGIEEAETPEQACIIEVKEETGYDVKVNRLLVKGPNKYTFVAEIIGGELFLDSDLEANHDIIDVAWVSLDDQDKFDHITAPLLDLMKAQS